MKEDNDQNKEALKARTLELYADAENKPEPEIPFPEPRNDDDWDCESIVSTYTNTENHYGLITADSAGQKSHVRLSNKTGSYIERPMSIFSPCARSKTATFLQQALLRITNRRFATYWKPPGYSSRHCA